MNATMTVSSPVGPIMLTASDGAISALSFCDGPAKDPGENDDPVLTEAARQLEEYFAGTRSSFTVPLAPHGTPFQRAVWQALTDIPYGKTVSYRDVAVRIGHPEAVRAVGSANGRNPIAILVPCHRVIGADGSLTGYAYGLEAKRFLLDLETGTGRLL